jgi:hypothetical protein
MKNPFRINPAVKLLCTKIEEQPWKKLTESRLYSLYKALWESCTLLERRALHKSRKISESLHKDSVYNRVTKEIVSGEYNTDRLGLDKVSQSLQPSSIQAVSAASITYNEMVRQKYMMGQATPAELYGNLIGQANFGTNL